MSANIQISSPHLFEFMDLDALPLSIRNTLREILECGNEKPFRGYYDWVITRIIEHATQIGAKQIVELGAGTAPLTRRLVHNQRCAAQLIICDINPDIAAYQELKQQYPERVTLIEKPVDFSQPLDWPDSTLLILSATLHHLPDEARGRALKAMAQSADGVLVVEPLRNTLLSLLLIVFSVVPAILLPLCFVRRPGLFRRIFWCWILPLAPLMFLWDGWVSCIRQWSDARYKAEAGTMTDVSVKVTHTLFFQAVQLIVLKRVR